MELTELQAALLAALYAVRFVEHRGSMDLGAWGADNGHTLRDVDDAFRVLREHDLAERVALDRSRTGTITVTGVLHAEENGLVPHEVAVAQRKFRTDFLVALADLRDGGKTRTATDGEALARQIGAGEGDFDANRKVLTETGYVESGSVRSFRITPVGYEAVREFRAKDRLRQDFVGLRDAPPDDPADRAGALATLIAAKCRTDGWDVEAAEPKPGSPGVLAFHRELNFVLAACVWEDGETGGPAVRSLRGRVLSRPGTFGCLFSMTAVSDGAISEAQTHLEAASIIIFGPDDLDELFHGADLTGAINAKLADARIRRQVRCA